MSAEPVANTSEAAKDPHRILTVRPGRGAPLTMALAVVVGIFVFWATPQLDDARRRWDGGQPVLVTVTNVDAAAGEVIVEEWAGDMSWSLPTDDVPEPVVGARIQSRVVGECRCELMVAPPGSLPWWIRAVPFVLGASALRGLVARRRWRSVGSVLKRPPTPVRVSPLWLRRSIVPPVLAVRVRQPSAVDDPGQVLELAGTAAEWMPATGEEVLLYGPDRSTGLTVLQSASGRAVASSVLRSGALVERQVFPWSSELAAWIWPPGRVEGPVMIGGRERDRIRVTSDRSSSDRSSSGGPGAEPRLVYDPRWVFNWVYAYPFVGFLVVGFLAWANGWTAGWAVGAMLAAFAAVRLVFDRLVKRSAGRAPLASWEDRTAARRAAEAAVVLGYVPPRGRGQP